jgi:hypothetical protein
MVRWRTIEQVEPAENCERQPLTTHFTQTFAVNHDWLMSRWLDDMVVARNRKADEPGMPGKESQPVQPLRLKVEATAILLFGGSTADSGRFRVLVDGDPAAKDCGMTCNQLSTFRGSPQRAAQPTAPIATRRRSRK